MRKTNGSVLAVLLALAAYSRAGDVHLPKPEAIPSPMPASGAVVLESGDYLFVPCDQATLVRTSPEGIIAFEEVEQGTHHWKVNGEKKKYKTTAPVTYLFEVVAAGTVTVEFFWSDGSAVKTKRMVVECRGAIPPPKPIDPKPEPKPEPEPIAKSPWDNAPGLRVLIVYPARTNLTASQQSIVTGKRVRDYLDANTVKESGEPAYWILKTNEDVSGLSAGWQRAYATTKGDRWVVVGNGSKWTAVPLPENPDKMLELLGRFQ